jgi:CheY-like chemotaxis protein
MAGLELRDLLLAAVAVVAVAAMILARRRHAPAPPRDRQPPSPPTGEAPRDAADTSANPPKELMAAWVQFLRDEVADAANALNNRLSILKILSDRFDRSRLSQAQVDDLGRMGTEVERATAITAKLLSRVSSAAPQTGPPAFLSVKARPQRPGVILVIEDDDANRQVITRLLTKLGHKVIAARDGLEAFPALEFERVDCVVCDIQMPGMGGRALYEQVEEAMPHLIRQFVFVTGDYTRPSTREFLERTGCPVVPKPYEVQSLLDAVRIVLERAEVLHSTPDDGGTPATDEPSVTNGPF